MDWEDRVVLLTGASRGIGRALARWLAARGARLVLTARTPDALGSVADALRRDGGEVIDVAGDVGLDADAARMAAAAHEVWGRVDVLVNNAGVLFEPQRLVDTTPEVWEETLRVNVVGCANMIRHVLPRMEARGAGLIVNLSSTWGRTAAGRVAPYCASKFAVEGLTQSLAQETAPGVIVFALNPGVIGTDMLATAFGGDVSMYTRPDQLDENWAQLFDSVTPAWHGTSRDLS